MRDELIKIRREIADLNHKLRGMSLYSAEGKRLNSRKETLEARLPIVERKVLQDEGQGELF